MKIPLKIVTYIILALCGYIPYCSASDSLQTNVHNIETGLPSNHVYSVVRDRNGYTWFLTDNGIVKYNGYSYKLFNTSNGLPSNDVWYLSEDSYGRLWVYTHAYEVGYIKDDKYEKIGLDTKNSFVHIMKYAERSGYIYLWLSGVFDNQFIVVDSAGKARCFPSKALTPVYMGQSDSIIVQYMLKDNIILKPGKNGLQVVSKRKAVFLSQFSSMCGAILPSYNIIGYSMGSAELIFVNLIACVGKLANLKDFGAEKFELVYVGYTINDQFYLISDRNIFFLDQHYNLLKRYRYSDLFKKLVQLTYYYSDPYGSEWYSTKTDGCLQVFKGKRGLYNADVFAHADMKNSRLVGRFKDGRSWWFDEMMLTLVGIDKELKVASKYNFSEKVVCVAQGEGTEVYIVFTNSIKKLDLSSGDMTPLVNDNNPVYVKKFFNYDYAMWLKKNNTGEEELNDQSKKSATKHFSLLHQYKPDVLYGLTPYGFRRISIAQNNTRIETVDYGKLTGLYFDMYHNKYWVYNKGRVLVFDPETGRKADFTNDVLALLGIQSVEDIKVDRYNNVFIQNADGILIFHPLKNTARQFSANANLTNCKMQLCGDKIVVAGKFGVAYATAYAPLTLGKVNIVPNAKSQHYNQLYDFTGSDSSILLLNSDKGHYICNLYNPDITSQVYRPDSNIQKLVLISPFQQSLAGSDTIRLSPSIDKINLDYINYLGKGDRLYTYKIEGMPGWEQTTSGEIFLANLGEEKVYKIECSVKDELWKSKIHTFYIYKIPYWYQSSYWRKIFWIGSVLLFAVFTITIVLVTRKIVARSNMKKQVMVDLELRAIYSQINPHFIFNTLSSALYFISKKDFDGAYNNISKFSRLLRAYLKSSRNRYTLLSEEIDMLKNYVELQKDRFEQKFDYAIEVDNKLPVDSIQIPSLLLQPLVENAINHGLFHMEKDGFLLIKFEQGKNSSELICHVEDNGIGRERAKEINRESNTKLSYGTTLTSELVALFQRYEQMDIQIEYIDKELPETGTIVKLFIRNFKFIA